MDGHGVHEVIHGRYNFSFIEYGGGWTEEFPRARVRAQFGHGDRARSTQGGARAACKGGEGEREKGAKGRGSTTR